MLNQNARDSHRVWGASESLGHPRNQPKKYAISMVRTNVLVSATANARHVFAVIAVIAVIADPNIHQKLVGVPDFRDQGWLSVARAAR